MKTLLTHIASAAGGLFVIAGLSGAGGCTTAQEREAASLAEAVAPLVQSYAATGRVDYAQAIPVALESIAVFDPAAKVDTAQLADSIENAVGAFTNNTGGATGRKIAAAVIAALPANPNGAQVNAALAQAGVGASDGAN